MRSYLSSLDRAFEIDGLLAGLAFVLGNQLCWLFKGCRGVNIKILLRDHHGLGNRYHHRNHSPVLLRGPGTMIGIVPEPGTITESLPHPA